MKPDGIPEPGLLPARPLTRRQLLQVGSLGTLALFLGEACGTAVPSPLGSTSPLAAPTVPPVPSPSPTPGPVLTADALLTAVGDLATTGTLALPGGGSATVADLSAAGVAFAVAGPQVPRLDRNPLAALGLALAAADWSGQTGAVDLAGALPKLPLTPVRLVLPQLPGGQTTDTLGAAVPAGLTLRPGCALLLAGVLADGRIVAGMADPARTVAGHPRLALAVLTTATLAPLLALAGASLDPSGASLTLSGGTHVLLTPIEPALAARLVAGAGVLFVDQVPLQPKGAKPALTVEPIVPGPDPNVVSRAASVQRAADGRLLALNAAGTAVGRAQYIGGTPAWDWHGADGLDWNLRELADRIGLTFTTFVLRDAWSETAYRQAFEGVANAMVIARELDADWVFSEFRLAQWRQVISDWPAISRTLAAGDLPDGFTYTWSQVDEMLGFARSQGLRWVRAGNLVCTFGDSMGDGLMSIFNGGFSKAELRGLLEFMIKTRVIRYRGQIQEWGVSAEASACLLWGGPRVTFWYDRLGTGIIDQAYRWAHETDPKAKLVFTEDAILPRTIDDASRQLADRFFSFLRHFRAANVPVDRVVLENNLWIFRRPPKASIVETLRMITSLGYEIASGETTVITSDRMPISGETIRGGNALDRPALQAAMYRDVLEAYLEVGGDFGIGGFSDRYSWYDENGPSGTAAMILDANYRPKPAYLAVRDVLMKRAGLT